MRAGRGAAVGVVAKGVDVHATLSTGIVASNVPGDGGGVRLGGLLEGDSAGDLGVTTDDANYMPSRKGCQPAIWVRGVNVLGSMLLIITKLPSIFQYCTFDNLVGWNCCEDHRLLVAS